jgi:hypothetical protein
MAIRVIIKEKRCFMVAMRREVAGCGNLEGRMRVFKEISERK